MNKSEILNKEEYKKQISNDVQLVDVRTPEEYNDGYIKNAENVDIKSQDFIEKIEKYSKSNPVYVYCRSGVRSQKAAEIMIDRGFSKVIDLEGGYINWMNSN